MRTFWECDAVQYDMTGDKIDDAITLTVSE